MTKEIVFPSDARPDTRSLIEFVNSLQVGVFVQGNGPGNDSSTPEQNLGVWRFPDPAALTALSRAAYSNQAIRHLPFEFLPPGFQHVEEIGEIRSTVITDRPGSRRIVRHELVSAINGSTITVFGKIFYERMDREIYLWTETLWRLSEQNATFFKIARPLSHDESLRIVWQKGIEGNQLSDRLTDKNYRKIMVAIARGLAAYHHIEYPIEQHVTINNRLESLATKVRQLSAIFPGLEQLVRKLEARLKVRAAALQPFPEFTLHGDFNLGQLLVSNNRLALLDCPEPVLGDPLQDMATIIADLHKFPFEKPTIDAMKSVLMESYLVEMGIRIPADRLRWHLSVEMMMQADQNHPPETRELEAAVLHRLEVAQSELELIGRSDLK